MSDTLGGSAYAIPRADSEPLSQQELQLQQKLLSDPIGFPISFKRWLVNFLEISDIALGQSNVIGLTTALGTAPGMTGNAGILPTGTCILAAGATPTGTLLCNGGAYDSTVYVDLYKAIGHTYGGSGPTFNVPNIPAPVANTHWVIVT